MENEKIYHKSCTICNHPEREKIHKLKYQARENLEEICKKINGGAVTDKQKISSAALSRHFSHVGEYIERRADEVIENAIKNVEQAKTMTLELAFMAYNELKKEGRNADIKLYAVWYQLVKLAFVEIGKAPETTDDEKIRQLWNEQRKMLEQKEKEQKLPLISAPMGWDKGGVGHQGDVQGDTEPANEPNLLSEISETEEKKSGL